MLTRHALAFPEIKIHQPRQAQTFGLRQPHTEKKEFERKTISAEMTQSPIRNAM